MKSTRAMIDQPIIKLPLIFFVSASIKVLRFLLISFMVTYRKWCRKGFYGKISKDFGIKKLLVKVWGYGTVIFVDML